MIGAAVALLSDNLPGDAARMVPITTTMSPWRLGDLLELAFDLSMLGIPWIEQGLSIADPPLFDWWANQRQLANAWQEQLDQLLATPELPRIAALSAEICAVDTVARILGTTFAAVDRMRELAEYRAIADHVVLTIHQQRLRVLTAVVQAGEPLAAADRFRRRCERWTDLLIGPLLVRFGTSAFAYDARRSWEFGEDFDRDSTAEMMHRIVQPTLRSAFRGGLADLPMTSPTWDAACTALLNTVPTKLQAESLQRWRERRVISVAVTPEADGEPVVTAERSAWSLLARCLQLVDGRRQQPPKE